MCMRRHVAGYACTAAPEDGVVATVTLAICLMVRPALNASWRSRRRCSRDLACGIVTAGSLAFPSLVCATSRRTCIGLCVAPRPTNELKPNARMALSPTTLCTKRKPA